MRNESARLARGLLQPSFLVSCAVLGVAAFGLSPMIFARGTLAYKEPVELRRTLGQFDASKLGPYVVMSRNTLSASMEDALGAEDYLDWHFEDSSVEDPNSPYRYVHMMVTYHSGGRDVVPHIPEQCYLGAGYSPSSIRATEVAVPALKTEVPLRVITFTKSEIYGNEEIVVVYTFHCNGEFAVGRNGVRRLVNSPGNRHAYYAKVELTFGSRASQPGTDNTEGTVEATAKFLNVLLPVLIEDHLPDWEAVKEAERQQEKSGQTT